MLLSPANISMWTLVYHDGAMGDMLLSLPCLEKLRAASGWVHLIGRRNVAQFLKDAGVVDAVTSSDQALIASLYSTIDRRLRTFLAQFDLAYVFTAKQDSAAAAAIGALIPHTLTIRTIPPDGSQMHAAQYRFSQIEPGGLLSSERIVLRVPPEKANEAQSLLRKAGYCFETRLIAVHPGSGSKLKCWPLQRYFELIERLQVANDAFVILFTGDAEDGELREEVDRYARGRKNTLHAADLELLSAASLLSHCGLYFGNDSGFSHLAGLLGCTTIVLFGSTDPLRWKPMGPRVTVVDADNAGPMTKITVDDVIANTESTVK
jgi:ADP-heptose:LPS heptosyltransferase